MNRLRFIPYIHAAFVYTIFYFTGLNGVRLMLEHSDILGIYVFMQFFCLFFPIWLLYGHSLLTDAFEGKVGICIEII